MGYDSRHDQENCRDDWMEAEMTARNGRKGC